MESSYVELITRTPDETRAVGRLLGVHAAPGDVFLLVGALGTGKTCLAQGILWGLGSDEYARSPTFVLVSQYQGRLTMYHMDLYRVDSIEEITDLELDEYLFGDGVCVVEWAEKAPGIFTQQGLTVQIDYVDATTRRLTLIGVSQRFARILEAVQSATIKL